MIRMKNVNHRPCNSVLIYFDHVDYVEFMIVISGYIKHIFQYSFWDSPGGSREGKENTRTGPTIPHSPAGFQFPT